MDFKLDHKSDTPLYLQLADCLEAGIRDGSLPAGIRLEAERKMCQRLGIARGTVKKAYLELAYRGCLQILPASGAYIQEIDKDIFIKEIQGVIQRLRQQNLSKWEIKMMAQEASWNSLPLDSCVRIAWVDCSPELLRPITAQIRQNCHVDVVSLLLDDIAESPALLEAPGIDMFVTTINHYDEMRSLLRQCNRADEPAERLVLSLSRQVVSSLATICDNDHIAVFYDSAHFRRAVEMFLAEYGAQGNYCYYSMRYSQDNFVQQLAAWDLVILPPDLLYMDKFAEKIHQICTEHGIKVLPFESTVDYGSLLGLKERARRCWLEKLDTI